MRIHQCPKCELRYPNESEVKDHMVRDHGVQPESLEHHFSGMAGGVHPHRHAPDPRASDSERRDR